MGKDIFPRGKQPLDLQPLLMHFELGPLGDTPGAWSCIKDKRGMTPSGDWAQLTRPSP
jgi:hypothetical protein